MEEEMKIATRIAIRMERMRIAMKIAIRI